MPAAVLLLFPADRLLSSLVELRTFDCFTTLNDSPRPRPWWWVPTLWLDPCRGFVGTFLLLRALELTTAFWSLVPPWAYGWCLVILGLSALSQTFTRRGGRGVLLAPVGFLTGVIAAVVPWPVALITVVAGFLGLCAFRHFHAFFGFGALALPLLGLAWGTAPFRLIAAAGVLILPLAIAFLTGSTLQLPARDDTKVRAWRQHRSQSGPPLP